MYLYWASIIYKLQLRGRKATLNVFYFRGVNMYAMLTGKLPYTAEPFHITALYNKMKNNEMNPLPEHLSAGK